MVSFGTAIANGWRNYVNFTGRSSRAEYWWWQLFLFLAIVVLSIIDIAVFNSQIVTAGQGLHNGNPGVYADVNTGPLGTIFILAVLLPSLALTVRRIRDAGFYWPWIFIGLVPFGGGIVLFVFTLLPTNDSERNIHAKPTYRDNRQLTIY
jgi:uncharacterized membrane protein YhaH (DUF805 family)